MLKTPNNTKSPSNPTIQRDGPLWLNLPDELNNKTTQALAEKFRKLPPLVSEIEANELKQYIPSGETPLWYYWEEFLLDYLEEGRSEVTIKKVSDALRFLIYHCKIYTIESTNRQNDLKNALQFQRLKREWQGSTFNTYRKNINTYFVWLEDTEKIGINKVRKIRKRAEAQNEHLTLSEQQISTLLSHITMREQNRLVRWRNTVFIQMLLITAARPCEILDLKVSDLTPTYDGYKITLRGKKQKGKPRMYDTNSALRDSFEIYMKIREELNRNEPYLFVSSSKLTGWTYRGMRGLFRRLSRELEFKVTAYSIRRGAATLMKLKGLQEVDIMHHLGHRRLTTTQCYIQNSSELTRKGTDVLGSFIK